VGVGQARDVRERLQHARRGLAVDGGDQLGAPPPEGRLDGLRLDDAAPLSAHGNHLGAAALGDLDEEQAEAAALCHHHAITGLHDGGDGRLQPRAPRARHRERPRVLRLEHGARQGHHLVHDGGELGVELAEERRGGGRNEEQEPARG
jgi:hypothetical protein